MKLVVDFTDSNTAKANGLSEFVDEVSLTKSFGAFSFTAGKQAVMAAGYEAAAPRRDIYLVSKMSEAYGGNVMGLNASYSFMDQVFTVQHLELNTTNLTDKKVAGFVYNGNFMNGMISPLLSYHKLGTDRNGKYDVFTTIGLQVVAMNITTQIDYSMLTQEKATDSELNSVVAHVRYNYENFKPYVKYMLETGKGSYSGLISTNSAVETERTAYELGLEYVPTKEEDMNYHVVYNSAEAKETTGATKATDKTAKIYAGVSFGLNLLK